MGIGFVMHLRILYPTKAHGFLDDSKPVTDHPYTGKLYYPRATPLRTSVWTLGSVFLERASMATLATDVHSCFERKYLASERRRINRQPLHWIAAGGVVSLRDKVGERENILHTEYCAIHTCT